jgi:hypothetical protein
MRLAMTLAPGLLLLAAGLVLAFPEGSEPGHTGFGDQPDCSSCHYAGPDPAEYSGLFIKALPQQVEPGAELTFRLRLRDSEARVGGFQLVVVGESGSTGRLEPDQGQQLVSHDGFDYLGHSEPAAFVDHDDGSGRLLEWSIHWTAPDHPGTVNIHASAVAADDDRSALGDNAYVASRRIQVTKPD